jgi:hypothetical protein
MNRIGTCVVFLFLSCGLFGQLSLKQIDKRLDSLQTAKLNATQRIAAYQDQLKQINKEIIDLQNQKRQTAAEATGDFIMAKTSEGGAILRDKPSSLGVSLATIPPNSPIKVFRQQENLYFKVIYNDMEGYVNYSTIAANTDIDDFLNGKQTVSQNNTQPTTVVRTVNEKDPRFQKIVKLYGRENAIRIMNNEVWEGMSPYMTIESVGKPNSKSTITSDEGNKDIWEYNDYRLEFFNGSLSKIIKKK